MPSPVLKPGSRGAIVPIGGAEDKLHDRSILRRFAGMCQPDTGRVVVIPTAWEPPANMIRDERGVRLAKQGYDPGFGQSPRMRP